MTAKVLSVLMLLMSAFIYGCGAMYFRQATLTFRQASYDFGMIWNPKTQILYLTVLLLAISCTSIYCLGLVVVSYKPSANAKDLSLYGYSLIFVGHSVLMIAALKNAHLSTATLETDDYTFTQTIEANVSKRPNT